MHRTSIAFQLLIWVAGIHALLPHFPKLGDLNSHTIFGERDSKDALSNSPASNIGFVTFKLIQKQPSVGFPMTPFQENY